MPKFTRKSFGFNNNDWEQTSDDSGRTRLVPRFNVNPIEKRVGMLLKGVQKHRGLSLPGMEEYLQTKHKSYTVNDAKQPLVWMLGGGMVFARDKGGVTYYHLTKLGESLVGKTKPLTRE